MFLTASPDRVYNEHFLSLFNASKSRTLFLEKFSIETKGSCSLFPRGASAEHRLRVPLCVCSLCSTRFYLVEHALCGILIPNNSHFRMWEETADITPQCTFEPNPPSERNAANPPFNQSLVSFCVSSFEETPLPLHECSLSLEENLISREFFLTKVICMNQAKVLANELEKNREKIRIFSSNNAHLIK